MRELTTIEMQGDKIPLLCTMEALEKIQDEFKSLDEFSERLVPTRVDKDGKKIPDSTKTPDLHAIVFSLPLLVEEGIEMYNQDHKIKMEPMTRTEIFRRCDQSVWSTAMRIYEEFVRSIYAPKPKPPAETNRK